MFDLNLVQNDFLYQPGESSVLSLASDKLRLGGLQVQRYFLADWSAAQMSEF